MQLMTLCDDCKEQMIKDYFLTAVSNGYLHRPCSWCGRTPARQYEFESRKVAAYRAWREKNRDQKKDRRARYRPKWGEAD